MRQLLVILALFSLILLPATASAQQTNAPPGVGGVDQYRETIPQADGNQPTGPAGTGKSPPGSGKSPLSPSARDALGRMGDDGRAAADLAGSTAADQGSSGDQVGQGRGRKGGLDPAGPNATDPGPSGLSAVIERAVSGSGDGGMGIALPLILLASLLGAFGLAVQRRRTS